MLRETEWSTKVLIPLLCVQTLSGKLSLINTKQTGGAKMSNAIYDGLPPKTTAGGVTAANTDSSLSICSFLLQYNTA